MRLHLHIFPDHPAQLAACHTHACHEEPRVRTAASSRPVMPRAVIFGRVGFASLPPSPDALGHAPLYLSRVTLRPTSIVRRLSSKTYR